MENNCEVCGLCKLCNKPRIRARGNIDDPKLIIIGEAPGKNEDQEGKVFIGRSGSLLSEVLGEKEDSVYITNAVKCAPYFDPFDYSRGTVAPTKEQIEYCKPFLIRELSLFDPEKTAIMTLGASALTALVGNHKEMGKEAGNIKYEKIGEQLWKIIPNYHPSYILRGKKGTSIDKEFRSIIKQALSHDEEEPEEDRIWLIADPSRAIKEANLVVEAYKDREIDYVVYDCETSGLLPWKDRIIMYSFYAENVNDKSVAVPIHIQNIVHHENYPYKVIPVDIDLSVRDIAKINKAIGTMIETIPIVGHHCGFDIQFAVTHNIGKLENIKVYYDTLLLSHILIGRHTWGALDLKTLCVKWFGVPNWEIPIDTYRKLFRKIEDRTYANIPTYILGQYAAKDTYYNNILFKALEERLLNDETK